MKSLQWRASEFKTGTTQCKRCKVWFYYAVSWGDDSPRLCNQCKKLKDTEAEELLKNPPKEYISDSFRETTTIEKVMTAICILIAIGFAIYVIL